MDWHWLLLPPETSVSLLCIALVERGGGLSRGLYRWAALGYKHSEGESLLLVFVLIGYSLKLGSSGKALLPL